MCNYLTTDRWPESNAFLAPDASLHAEMAVVDRYESAIAGGCHGVARHTNGGRPGAVCFRPPRAILEPISGGNMVWAAVKRLACTIEVAVSMEG